MKKYLHESRKLYILKIQNNIVPCTTQRNINKYIFILFIRYLKLVQVLQLNTIKLILLSDKTFTTTFEKSLLLLF